MQKKRKPHSNGSVGHWSAKAYPLTIGDAVSSVRPANASAGKAQPKRTHTKVEVFAT